MFTTLHLFLIWRTFKRLSDMLCIYRNIVYNTVLTRLLEDPVRLNQNLSKYIAVVEKSYLFLIRDKSNICVFRQSAELKCTFVRS